MADTEQTPVQGSSGGTDIVTALQGIIRQITAANTQLAAIAAALVARSGR